MLDASVSPSTGQAQKYCPFSSQKASIHFSCLFFNAAHFTAIATLADTYDLFPYMFLSLSLSISLSLSSLPPSLLPHCLVLSSYASLCHAMHILLYWANICKTDKFGMLHDACTTKIRIIFQSKRVDKGRLRVMLTFSPL